MVHIKSNWTWARIGIVTVFIAIWLVAWFIAARQFGSIPQAGEAREEFAVFFAVMVVVGVLIPATIATLFFVELDRRRDKTEMTRGQSPRPSSVRPPSEHFPH